MLHQYVLKQWWILSSNDTGGGNYLPGVGVRGAEIDSGINMVKGLAGFGCT